MAKEVNTYLTDTIENSNTKERYDENAKAILRDKNILAHILKEVVEEFNDWEVVDIIPCIEGEVEVGKSNVMPAIKGSNTEDSQQGEGKITYDVKFDVVIPSSKTRANMNIKLIIDVELQAQISNLGYVLDKREMFYSSRLVSSQKETEFTNSNYDGIKKTYSIWICLNDDDCKNSIIKYSLKQEVLFGNVSPKPFDSLFNIILIYLDITPEAMMEKENKPTLVGMLSTVFTEELSVNEKLNRLETVYGLPKTQIIKEGVEVMCNISTIVGERKRAEGRIEGKIEMMLEDGLSIPEMAERLKLSEDKVAKIIEQMSI